jgi:hypothetical protein
MNGARKWACNPGELDEARFLKETMLLRLNCRVLA